MIINQYFEDGYQEIAQHDLFDQPLFYELGRNLVRDTPAGVPAAGPGSRCHRFRRSDAVSLHDRGGRARRPLQRHPLLPSSRLALRRWPANTKQHRDILALPRHERLRMTIDRGVGKRSTLLCCTARRRTPQHHNR